MWLQLQLSRGLPWHGVLTGRVREDMVVIVVCAPQLGSSSLAHQSCMFPLCFQSLVGLHPHGLKRPLWFWVPQRCTVCLSLAFAVDDPVSCGCDHLTGPSQLVYYSATWCSSMVGLAHPCDGLPACSGTAVLHWKVVATLTRVHTVKELNAIIASDTALHAKRGRAALQWHCKVLDQG